MKPLVRGLLKAALAGAAIGAIALLFTTKATALRIGLAAAVTLAVLFARRILRAYAAYRSDPRTATEFFDRATDRFRNLHRAVFVTAFEENCELVARANRAGEVEVPGKDLREIVGETGIAAEICQRVVQAAVDETCDARSAS